MLSSSEGKNILKFEKTIVPYFFEEPVRNKELNKSQMKLVEDKTGIKFTEISELGVSRHHLKIIITKSDCNDANAEWMLGESITTK